MSHQPEDEGSEEVSGPISSFLARSAQSTSARQASNQSKGGPSAPGRSGGEGWSSRGDGNDGSEIRNARPLEQIVGDKPYKSEMCSFYQRGICCFGKKCHFAHGKAELKPVTTERAAPSVGTSGRAGQPDNSNADKVADTSNAYKTKLCNFYERGICTNGARCVFAHGQQDLAPEMRKTVTGKASAPAKEKSADLTWLMKTKRLPGPSGHDSRMAWETWGFNHAEMLKKIDKQEKMEKLASLDQELKQEASSAPEETRQAEAESVSKAPPEPEADLPPAASPHEVQADWTFGTVSPWLERAADGPRRLLREAQQAGILEADYGSLGPGLDTAEQRHLAQVGLDVIREGVYCRARGSNDLLNESDLSAMCLWSTSQASLAAAYMAVNLNQGGAEESAAQERSSRAFAVIIGALEQAEEQADQEMKSIASKAQRVFLDFLCLCCFGALAALGGVDATEEK
mmetsp:Transcript_20688/g.45400  ORF Transcript_20688/g.45400 Transcript_20688/m.45400 type:complete len:458 (-) Transcript_20688:198-1571(-)